ncbi:TetR/AcrR family transcriptional regulator [Paenibacillus pabuli]|uniref:TetR/AcrR family transcriptional regulator n=1 Tax=Paenibacillus pabuli TaxID=1472 RepID=UPI001FFED39E|nr:TetR/AcrR family transcriptional regulator [Paenibacillus pabuli]UPK43729.1 TetR/AcrR family transcriptional regulator [Paenibacillus pabuli]
MVKERILDVARTEVIRSGFRFSMNDLSTQLGMSTKTIYELFSSKEDLLTALLDTSLAEIVEKEQQLLRDPSLSNRSKLRQSLVMLPADLVMFDLRRLSELQRYYPAVWSKLDRFIAGHWDEIRQLIQTGKASGELRAFDTEIFVQVYIGGLYRLMEHSASGSFNGGTLSAALQEMVDMLLEGVLPKEEQ